MPQYELHSKVFFVTGGAQGLGRYIIEALLAKGAKVFFVDILEEKGNATLDELCDRFGTENVAFCPTDVVNRQKLEDAFQRAVNLFGHIDVMFNNAGVIDEVKTKAVVEVNFLAAIQGTEIATAHMRKDEGGKGGRIITMSSIAGLNCYYQMPVYNATKHAVRVYSTALSQNPANEAMGLEFSTIHPDAATIGLFSNLNGKGIHQDTELVAAYQEHMVPPETVVEAFLELVSLEKMNGATYLVTKYKRKFMQVETKEMGDTFPLPQ